MNRKKKICLNMIVKNESKVIRRCIDSVKSIIDTWVIVDTGSTDGTQDIIREHLRDIPGELHERPWVNFSHNRTEAFRLAKSKADFSLLIDADEEIVFLPDFVMPDFKDDTYLIDVHYGPSHFHREMLVGNHLDWYWDGILHEQITCREMYQRKLKVAIIRGVINRSHPDGARNVDSKQKYRNDAALLEEALKKEPKNSRYMFYLGQSYAQCDELELAIKAYDRRSKMEGWDQEVYHSLYMIPNLQERLNVDNFTIVNNYAKAHAYRPTRAEPLGRIAYLFMRNNNPALAYIVAKYASAIPFPEQESMFVEHHVYNYGLTVLMMDAAFQLGKKEEACAIAESVLKRKDMPAELLRSVRENLAKMKAMNRFNIRETNSILAYT